LGKLANLIKPAIKSPFTLNTTLSFIFRYNTLLVFLIMVVIASTVSDVFFTRTNIFNLLRQVAGLGIVAMGMLIVILTGGIDLSVGSILAFTSVLSAFFLQTMSLPVSILLTIMGGVLLGSISGFMVAKAKMAPFVATLAMMTIARGMAFVLSEGSPIITRNEILIYFGTAFWLGIPLPVILMSIIFILFAVVLKYTVFGRLITAIGSNEAAVSLSGINVSKYKFLVYCISGALCAIAGIISTSRTGVGSPIVALGFELDAIAAVVIGGASLAGGRGNAFNTLLGVFILGMIGNIMNLMNVPGYPQQVIMGVIIIVAVLFQLHIHRRK
jgi:ribose transport system permease protein